METKLKPITSPTYELKILKNFPLKKLEEKFVIAEFERPLRMRHVKKIVLAMANNKFYDIVIHVILKRNGQYEIIDGQHRITALKELRDEYFVTKYNLIVMIFPDRLAREIYRRINLAQPLRMEEHLRALDDGRNPFFEKLRPYFVHYNDGNRPKYEMILNALSYAKNGSPRAVRALHIDRMFNNITPEDLKIVTSFSRALCKLEPFISKVHRPLYMFSTYRNMFRVGYENSFNHSNWEDFISICKEDKEIHKLHKLRTMQAVRELYDYMVKQVGKKMGHELNRVDRTLAETKQALKVSSPYKKTAIF